MLIFCMMCDESASVWEPYGLSYSLRSAHHVRLSTVFGQRPFEEKGATKATSSWRNNEEEGEKFNKVTITTADKTRMFARAKDSPRLAASGP